MSRDPEQREQEPRPEIGREAADGPVRDGVLLDDDRAVVLRGRGRGRLDPILLRDRPLLVGDGDVVAVVRLGWMRRQRHAQAR